MAGGDGKDKAKEPQEYKFAQKPEEKSGWEGFKQFLWNSETSEFLGRTGLSWLKIGVFYIIYYALLAGFFMGMLLIFYQTLDDKVPRWQNTNGIIGGNPGVGFRPMPDNMTDIESTLIWYRHGDDKSSNWKTWVGRLKDFLAPYNNQNTEEDAKDGKGKLVDRVECGPDSTQAPGDNQICKVDSTQLFGGNCTADKDFGYPVGSPCILLKLNKIYGWFPEHYNLTSEDKAPEKLPEELKLKMEANKANPDLNRKVWIECHGENPADKENIGELDYHPDQGFSSNHFPYLNQPGYLSPAVFVEFKNPKKGVMIAVECMAWADNIEHDSMDRRGLAHFELMVD